MLYILSFYNFLIRRHKSQKQIRRKKVFSPKIWALQASNLNFIDSLFSCRDNGGFLAELNSNLRIEAFTSLIMVSMIHTHLPLSCDQWWFWYQYPRRRVGQVTSTVGGWDSQIIKRRCLIMRPLLCEYKNDRVPEKRRKLFWWSLDVCQQGNMALAALWRGRNCFDQWHLGSWMVRNIVNTTKYY